MKRPPQASLPRIQILNRRQRGADESYCTIMVFNAGDERDALEMVRQENNIPEDPEGSAERRREWEAVPYVNDDITFADGDVLETADGRKLRLSLTEVFTERAPTRLRDRDDLQKQRTAAPPRVRYMNSGAGANKAHADKEHHSIRYKYASVRPPLP